MKPQDEHDLATQVAVLTQIISAATTATGKLETKIDKLESKIDSIIETYATKYVSKIEMAFIQDDIQGLQESNSKLLFWLLSTSVGLVVAFIGIIFNFLNNK